jgi:predicted amidohydrolase YtcJ
VPNRRTVLGAFAGAAAFAAAGCDRSTAPTASATAELDLIIHNGVIITMDDQAPRAQAVGIQGERIVAVGSDGDVMARRGSRTHLIDVQGRLEHLLAVRDDQIERVARMGAVASVQLTWLTSDWLLNDETKTTEATLGPQRIRWAGRWRDLLAAGLHVVGGTDATYTAAPSTCRSSRYRASRWS